MYKWVEDGIYDHQYHRTRYVIVNGYPKTVISDQWLNSKRKDELDPMLQVPFGTFPDMPPKPKKTTG